MKKIVFVTLMMADEMKKRKYPVDGNSVIEFPGEVYYPINGILSKNMKKNDEIKIVLLETKAGDMAGNKNADLFKEELDNLNLVGAKIDYEIISSEFVETKSNFKMLYKKMLGMLDYDAELYADITFGIKTLPLIIQNVISFGEKFFDCEVGNIIYLKAEFKNGILVEGSQIIYDITSLYMLNSFTSLISATSGEKALESINALLED